MGIRQLADFVFRGIFRVMIRQNILATLAYYDIFDFPLKKEEVFRFLVNLERPSASEGSQTSDFDEIEAELEKLITEGVVNFSDGFYYLFERDYLVPLRSRREKIAREKWKKALRAVRWLKFLPYIEAAFASGSLAMNNTEELGDLDTLIIVKHRRIWLSRLLISGLLSLIGMRRKYNEKIAPDKICLNHYITDKSLLIPYKSIYTAQTYINLKPVFISNPRIVAEFYKANSWLGDYVLNFGYNPRYFDSMIYHSKNLGRNFLAKIKSAAWEMILNSKLGDWLEDWAKRWQTKRIEEHKKQDLPGGRVVYNDDCLEFHPGSVEEEIIRNYENRIKKLFRT
jgi:hypothetical protein